MSSGLRRNRLARLATRAVKESLESRVMLCASHQEIPKWVEERPDLVGVQNPAEVLDPADIVWVNRANTTTGGAADTDGFGARFGTSAPLARGVVDAVIVAYERMIGSFDYSSAGITYNLTVNMNGAGSGFGASAGSLGSFGGKPRSGTISMGAGSNTADPNDANGWFLDPTPYDNSEFQGTIVNAFSGNAQSGSPAAGIGDFYTVVAAEMTHVMGLFGNALSGWSSRTTNTGVADTAEGGGVGTFYVFQGPSIKHLLTSNNAGAGGQNFGSAVHGAGPGVPVAFGGDTYIGAEDQGNAVYEGGRRYMINQTFALMFKDAYGYASVNPAQFSTGTMYSIRNQTTNSVLVRGGEGTSIDAISITRSGNTISVSVDPTADVAGTGALPGDGNLPAWVTNYDISEVSSISILAGSGADTINIAADVGLPITVNGGASTDILNVIGTTGDDVFVYSPGNVAVGSTTISGITAVESIRHNGGDGVDLLTLRGTAVGESASVNSATTGGTLAGTYTQFESILVDMLGGNDTITINSPSIPVSIDSGSGTDTINVTETAPGIGLTILPTADGASDTVNINTDATGSAVATFAADQSVGTINLGGGGTLGGAGNVTVATALNWSGGTLAGSGGVVIDTAATFTLSAAGASSSSRPFTINGQGSVTAGGSRVLVLPSLNVGATGALNLADNALIVDYTGGSPLASIHALLATGYAAGAWNGLGINTSAATPDRTLGVGEAAQIYSSFPASFAGQSVDDTSVLILFTIPGDANLDRSVNLDDFTVLAANFGTTGALFGQGNFNYDSDVNLDDFTILASQFGAAIPPAELPRLTTTRQLPASSVESPFSRQRIVDDVLLA